MNKIVENIRSEAERYDIQYKGETGQMHGVFLYDYPEISGGDRIYEERNVAGRIGALVGKDTGKNNLKISCTFSILGSAFMPNVRALRRWLRGKGQLILSDSPEVYYRVLKVDYGSIERELRNFGRFIVSFTCEPFEYLVSGQLEYLPGDLAFNPYSESRPIYKVSGEGECVIMVNGNAMTANVGQQLVIDTGKMLTVREDGEHQNTSVAGEYEELFLKEGKNAISISEGFDLKVIPNWGYEV